MNVKTKANDKKIDQVIISGLVKEYNKDGVKNE